MKDKEDLVASESSLRTQLEALRCQLSAFGRVNDTHVVTIADQKSSLQQASKEADESALLTRRLLKEIDNYKIAEAQKSALAAAMEEQRNSGTRSYLIFAPRFYIPFLLLMNA
jgi:hypothetical protein